MDIHVITPRGSVLVLQVVDGKLVIPPAPVVAQVQPAPGK